MSHHLQMMQIPRQTRQDGRHVVELPCELITETDDEPILGWATDMSAYGAWFDTKSPLSIGSSLVVCISPGIWWRAKELMAFAEVTRISRGMRGGDDDPGMAVRFLDLSPSERFALRSWLRPRPERLPRRRLPRRVIDVARRRYERALPIPAPSTIGSELRFPLLPAPIIAAPPTPPLPRVLTPTPPLSYFEPQSPFAARIC